MFIRIVESVSQASDALDFHADDYASVPRSEWKRTYRLLLKGTPCLPEMFCAMKGDVKDMVRSFPVAEAYAPLPSDVAELGRNETTRLYGRYLEEAKHQWMNLLIKQNYF